MKKPSIISEEKMKKTYNINLSGYGFVIDEDAYEILYDYLTTLQEISTREDQGETAIDIEVRIAEIFTEEFREKGSRILSRCDVERVIERMGAPEEIMGVEAETVSETPVEGATACPPPPPTITPHPVKRLFRDTSNRILGGVCSGLAWYLHLDPVWVRIIAVVLFFLTGSVVALIYIILWIIIPAAQTPLQRMQMMGMDPSVSNVGKVVTGDYCNPRAQYSQTATIPPPQESDSLSGVAKVILMILVIVALLIVGSLLLAISAALIGCTVALCFTPAVADYTDMTETRLILGSVVGGTLVAGLPLFLLFRYLIGSLTGRRLTPFNTSQKIFMLVLWLLGVAACIVCGILL